MREWIRNLLFINKTSTNIIFMGQFIKGGLTKNSDKFKIDEINRLKDLIKDCSSNFNVIHKVYNYIQNKSYYKGCPVSIVDGIVIVQKAV